MMPYCESANEIQGFLFDLWDHIFSGVVQVQQKVVGIIPSSTAATAQSFSSFQARSGSVNIRPNTSTSTQQVRFTLGFSLDMLLKRHCIFHSDHNVFSM